MKLVMYNISTGEVFGWLEQISDAGLVLNQDYTWHYVPPTNSFLGGHSPTWLGEEPEVPQHVEFDFVDDRWTTYFRLLWT